MKKVKKALSFVITSAFALVLIAVTAMAADTCDHAWTYEEISTHHVCTLCGLEQRHNGFDCTRCGWSHPQCSDSAGGHLYASTNSDVHDCLRACGIHIIGDNRHVGHQCEESDHWPPLNCRHCEWIRPDVVACGVCDPCIRSAADCTLECCIVCGLCGICDKCTAEAAPDPAPEQPAPVVPEPAEPSEDPADPGEPGESGDSAEPSDDAAAPPPAVAASAGGGSGTSGSPGGINAFTIVLAGFTVVIFAAAGFGATVLKKANA
jgi:hypothetical protein